jgi:cytokinin dehydrogenase
LSDHTIDGETDHVSDTHEIELPVFTREPILLKAADDFGHVVHRMPSAVAVPSDSRQVVELTRRAAHGRIPLVPRGQGHSTRGQAQVEGGIVLDMRAMHRVRDIQSDSVTVEAGATWAMVLDATLPRGLMPPVLTDYLHTTVGGTLSVGGIGGASHHHGLQTDSVLELEVVTADGRQMTCSRKDNPEEFNAIRGGHGRHGVIVAATIRLIPAPAQVRLHKLFYPDLTTFLRDQHSAMAERRFGHLQGQAKWVDGSWRYRLDAATYGRPSSARADPTSDLAWLRDGTESIENMEFTAFAHQLDEGEALLRAVGDWDAPHPWVNYFLPGRRAPELIASIMADLTVDDVGKRGIVLIYPIETALVSTPGILLPDEPVAYLFCLLRTAAPDGTVTAEQMLAANEVLDGFVTGNGGTIYLGPVDDPTSAAR